MAFPNALFVVLAPEYKDVASATLELVGAEAARFVNTSVWGGKADLGVVYMTAHMLKMAERRGTGGQVTQEKVGELSRSYAQGEKTDDLDQTSYGKEFKRVRSTLQISPFVVT
jgi:hypothetical protein